MIGAPHSVANNQAIPLLLSCNEGDTLVSGGYQISSGSSSDSILSSFPTPEGWQVDVVNISGQNIIVDLYAVCHTNS